MRQFISWVAKLRLRQKIAIAVIVVLLTLACWHWWPPHKMRLITRIPCTADSILITRNMFLPAFFGKGNALYLHVDRSTSNPGPSIVSLIGWDGHPRWKLSTSIEQKVYCNYYRVIDNKPDYVSTIALSPDGSVFAQVRHVGENLFISSWRNGRLLGKARITWLPPIRKFNLFTVQATDAGRVWINSNYYYRKAIVNCHIWAIDGSRVATGAYPTSVIGTHRFGGLTISPDGMTLISYGAGLLEYAKLSVFGSKVVVKPTYSASKIDDGLFVWIDNDRALGDYGTFVEPTGVTLDPQKWRLTYSSVQCDGLLMLQRDTNIYRIRRLRIFRSPAENSWVLPDKTNIAQCNIAPQGKDALIVEVGLRKPGWFPGPVYSFLEQTSLLDRFNSSRQIAVYTVPGRLRATLPIPRNKKLPDATALAPYIQHAAFYFDEDMYQPKEICVYGW